MIMVLNFEPVCFVIKIIVNDFKEHQVVVLLISIHDLDLSQVSTVLMDPTPNTVKLS